VVARAFEQHVVEALHRVDHLLQFAFFQASRFSSRAFSRALMSLALALQGEQLDDQAFEHATQFVDVDGRLPG
jgi:hypothetical protein